MFTPVSNDVFMLDVPLPADALFGSGAPVLLVALPALLNHALPGAGGGSGFAGASRFACSFFTRLTCSVVTKLKISLSKNTIVKAQQSKRKQK